MTRLYAFSQCEVIVDPFIDPADDFPSEPVDAVDSFFFPGAYKHAWGFINSRPYAKRGWVRLERFVEAWSRFEPRAHKSSHAALLSACACANPVGVAVLRRVLCCAEERSHSKFE